MVSKTFVLSGSALWGWSATVELDAVDSLDALVAVLMAQMDDWVNLVEVTTGQADLYGLRREVEDYAFHFHGATIDDVKGAGGVVYVCCCGAP